MAALPKSYTGGLFCVHSAGNKLSEDCVNAPEIS